MDESQISCKLNSRLESSLNHGYNGTNLSSWIDGSLLPDVVNGGFLISKVPEKAMEVKLAVTAELQSLKQVLEERGHPRPQDEELISALKEQIARLTQRGQYLEQKMEAVCKENSGLGDSVSSLYTRLARQEQQINTQTQQLAEAWQEVELWKGKVQGLHCKIEELQEEVSFQRTTDANASLLSEMERSLDAINQSQDEEQELKRPIVGGNMALCENPAWIQELQDQNAQLLTENAELRLKADSRPDKEIVQRAIKDRDDAISKKTAVEAELVRSRNDIMHLNNQLLEAIQRKLELSQELEAWQDDIQVIINQQLKSQTDQQMQSKRSGGGRISFFRKHLKARSSVSCIPEATAVSNGSPWINWLKVAK